MTKSTTDIPILDDGEIAEIEARAVVNHHLDNGAYIGCYILLSTSERDTLCQTVRHLLEENQRLRSALALAARRHVQLNVQGWQYVHEREANLVRKDGVMCETHPGLEFGHDPECDGPGMAWVVEGRAAVESLLSARISRVNDTAMEILDWLNFDTSLEIVQNDIEGTASIIQKHLITTAPASTAADHERMKETLDALSECPTEEEAEAALRACGTSGKEVVNEFIERLLRENLELKTKLAAATPPSTLARKAAEEIQDWLRTGDGEVDGNAINEVAAIIERCFAVESGSSSERNPKKES